MLSPKNRAVIAAAGSKKTQLISDQALDAPRERRVLITTHTRYNCEQIIRRLHEAYGCVPENVEVVTWYSFLMNQAARPYQSAITAQIDYAGSLNFKGSRSRFTSREKEPLRYYFDRNDDFYRDGLAEFAVRVDKVTCGKVIRRLERLYDELCIDEFQDLGGYDLDLIDLLFRSSIGVTVVGDPRQYTYSTNQSPRNQKYRGAGIVDWLKERPKACHIEERTQSWRCNQKICSWADKLFPEMSPTNSLNHEHTGHDDVFLLAREDVSVYVGKFQPTVLRWDKNTDTLGLRASNMRASKGCTFKRVLIFPPQTIAST